MRFRFLVVFVLLSSCAVAQTSYKLDFRVKGWKDTTVYLGYYFSDLTYLQDTAHVDSKGTFTFQKKKPLTQGVYFLVLANSKLFDFVVGADQEFMIETSTEDFIKNLKVTGDEDNRVFFENVEFNVAHHLAAEPYIKILQDTTIKDDKTKKEAREAFEKINVEVVAYQNKIIESNPALLTARILKSTHAVEIPPAPKKPDGSIDSSFQFRYYREHFFDNFDLADEALMHLPKPFYREKVKEYLDKLFIPQADTISHAIDQLALLAKKNQATYKYLIYTCVYLYQTPEIMGLDAVFVHLYKKYFEPGDMDYWANAQLKKNLKERSDKIGRAMIGQTAPNLMMQDQNLVPKSLYDIRKKYTIIYFFDPDCGHCRKESPKLVSFYNKNKTKFDLEVFAVSADTSLQKMKDYIKEMKMTWITVNGPRTYLKENYHNLYYAEQTPTLYIIDSRRQVIARKLPVEKLEDFLTNYNKFINRKITNGKGT